MKNPSFEIVKRHLAGGILDPQVAAVLQAMEEQGGPALETLPVADSRAIARDAFRELGGERLEVGSVEERILPTDNGPVSVRIYTPKGSGSFPVLMYFHGGGWVWCDADTHEAACRYLCRLANCIVIFVNYRRSPEYRFPAANDDAYYATKWVSDHASEINADPRRIAVGGDSAGGNMSAALALRVRETKDFRLAFQLLVYPVTDMSDMDVGTYETYGEGYFLTRPLMKWFREQYLNSMDEAMLPQVSPLLEQDLTGLPPALVITAEFDPLRQEGEAYAQRLANAGVPVQCSRFNGMIHPFWSMAGKVDQALAAYREAASALQKAFGII